INLPTNLKLGGGWTKRILRESFAELPPSVRWRRDKGYFGVPEERWLRAEMGSFVRKIFSNSILDQMGVLDSGAFLQAYNGFQNHRVDISPMDISRVLIAEIWAQQFLGNIPLSLSAGRLSQRKLAGAESSAQ
ncbi:MAG: asparagine synthase-related protein, partial [Blastocatellia bacterium]